MFRNFYFALKVNIHIQNMRSNVYFRWFCVCVCSLSLGIIDYACPNFRTTCALPLMLTLQHEFDLSPILQFHPTIRLVAYVYSCFIIIRQNVFPVSFSTKSCKIIVRPRGGFQSADIFVRIDRNLCSRRFS